jgi:hypothetical protein
MGRRAIVGLVLIVGSLAAGTASSQAQDSLYFTALQDSRKPILDLINAEQVRIDVAAWWFTDRTISDAIIRKFRSGVQVRFIGDANTLRSTQTKTQLEYLAASGIPMRLRSPAGVGGVMHWKCAIFAGQNAVEFGSANWTVYSLRPYSSTNYDDETVQVTKDQTLVPAFKMMFDRMWVDTATFSDYANVAAGSRLRLEPDAPQPPSMTWYQGQEYNDRLIREIEAEQVAIDFVLYRLKAASVTEALARRKQAGVAVRLVIDPVQYRNAEHPQASANLDRLWSLSIPIKKRTHSGMTHMKTIVTSTVATNSSSNVTDGWQRDHNYFVEKALKPALYQKLKDRVAAMIGDTVGFGPFRPQSPGNASLFLPANGATGVSQTPLLDWSDASWATNYDVFLGTSTNSMNKVGGLVSASQFRVTATLQPSTVYYWRVRARTNATPRDATLSATSATWSFRTGNSLTSAPPAPTADAPSDAVLRAASVPAGDIHGQWYRTSDQTAAGGVRLWNPNKGAAKILTASASPASYFDVFFSAEAGRAYHVWLRMKAENDSYTNDSAFVQFSGTVTATGSPAYRIGTTSAAEVSLQHSSGALIQGWGWNDNGWGGLGAHVYFGQTGTQRIRVQVREDGLSVDQIVISPVRYLTSSPGALTNDTTIVK